MLTCSNILKAGNKEKLVCKISIHFIIFDVDIPLFSLAATAPLNLKYDTIFFGGDNGPSLVVSWRPPSHPNGLVTSYNVYVRRVMEGVEWEQQEAETLPVTQDSTGYFRHVFTIHGGFEYMLEVAAVNEAGQGTKAVLLTERKLNT